ncbi:hypothetical protein DSL92_05270 [Billgrantia gudaonensis]|uniref:Uncharacterized protein n=1 Tax=Billgrantia gudaonensis TaxID=376427 RepID=A0A3S0QFY6_9GAMM|nr:hypothetical protein DSL92_05270 [Halomonas gudaonensis]
MAGRGASAILVAGVFVGIHRPPGAVSGTALVLVGRNLTEFPAVLPRSVMLPLAVSLSATALVWFALTWQHYDARLTKARELLSSFKVSAEREIDQHQLLLQRMAERWGSWRVAASPGFRARVRQLFSRHLQPGFAALAG